MLEVSDGPLVSLGASSPAPLLRAALNTIGKFQNSRNTQTGRRNAFGRAGLSAFKLWLSLCMIGGPGHSGAPSRAWGCEPNVSTILCEPRHYPALHSLHPLKSHRPRISSFNAPLLYILILVINISVTPGALWASSCPRLPPPLPASDPSPRLTSIPQSTAPGPLQHVL